jgi:hypothetical protein
MQRAESHRQNINREQARLIETQYNLEILRQQACEAPLHNQINNQPPPPSPPDNHILHQPNQPPQTHPLQPPLLPQMCTTDPKSPLVEHLQLTLWPLHYRAATPPKYHSNTEPHKFPMCYEAAIASTGGDEATLTKSLIISLEDAAANWYSRLPPHCIYSWQQLKDKIPLNFQGLQSERDTEEDFLSCIQKEREPLPKFYQRFLQLKAHAPEVSDEQVIAQAIKALRAGTLHNHMVREQPKIVPKLYDQFAKFSKLEIQHFCKLEQ